MPLWHIQQQPPSSSNSKTLRSQRHPLPECTRQSPLQLPFPSWVKAASTERWPSLRRYPWTRLRGPSDKQSYRLRQHNGLVQLSHGWHVRSKRNWDKWASHTFCVRLVQIQRLHSDHFSPTTRRRGHLRKLDHYHFRVERILRHGPFHRYGSQWPNMRSHNTQQYYGERECNSIV